MGVRSKIHAAVNRGFLNRIGFELKRVRKNIYDQDGLCSMHNHEFMHDPKFVKAYQRGLEASEKDYSWHWRVHAVLWAASSAAKLTGAFVECGVNRGFMSSAVMDYLDWNSLDRNFYLFDTFKGLDPSQVNDEEVKLERIKKTIPLYKECYEKVVKNFSEYNNVHIVCGAVPESLKEVEIKSVCYLALDMNCTYPEIEALKFFWPKMVQGGLIVMDDYAYLGYEPQKKAFDAFANEMGVNILSLPTGQGLLIKS